MFNLHIDKESINWKSIILGGTLNILVVIVFVLIYNAYVTQPKTEAMQIRQSIPSPAPIVPKPNALPAPIAPKPNAFPAPSVNNVQNQPINPSNVK